MKLEARVPGIPNVTIVELLGTGSPLAISYMATPTLDLHHASKLLQIHNPHHLLRPIMSVVLLALHMKVSSLVSQSSNTDNS